MRNDPKEFQQATDEAAAAVERSLAGASRKDIQQALLVELKRRGFPDVEPDRTLIDRIRAAGR